jgi:hypothetical protein
VPLPLANSYPASAISLQLTSITPRRKTKRTQFGAATLLTERTQFPPKSHKTQGQKCCARCEICLGRGRLQTTMVCPTQFYPMRRP